MAVPRAVPRLRTAPGRRQLVPRDAWSRPPAPAEPPGLDEPDERVARLLDEAEDIVNLAGPRVLAEVEAERARQHNRSGVGCSVGGDRRPDSPPVAGGDRPPGVQGTIAIFGEARAGPTVRTCLRTRNLSPPRVVAGLAVDDRLLRVVVLDGRATPTVIDAAEADLPEAVVQ